MIASRVARGRPRRARLPIEAAAVVSGERVQALAELSLVSARTRAFHHRLDRFARETVEFERYDRLSASQIERVARAASLFINTHEFGDFAEHVWPRLSGSSYVLITHNSDAEVGPSEVAWLDEAGQRVHSWFAQNATVEHPKLTPVPIGIANGMWEHGNLRALARAMRTAARSAPDRQLFARFTPSTHAERAELVAALREYFPAAAAAHASRTHPRHYLQDLSRHAFCVCPRGNGIDTHRLWEALYVGVTPIAKRSPHTAHWQRIGLPLVLVDEWSELTPQLLAATVERSPRPATSAALRLDYYSKPICASAAAVSRFPDWGAPAAR